MKIRRYIVICVFLWANILFSLQANGKLLCGEKDDGFVLTQEGVTSPLLYDEEEEPGVLRAVQNLLKDMAKVTGSCPHIVQEASGSKLLIVGSFQKSRWIQQLCEKGLINKKELSGKREKYIIITLQNPFPGVDEALVIVGSDKRGTIYGIYELLEQVGVSPWNYWADVPVVKRNNIYIKRGVHTDGEPAVRYRGIFLNDEAPALSGWAHHSFGGFNHLFYEKVFELILRLKGNLLWPAMWGNAFFDDDPRNGILADEMGVVIGTSHHEPMGRAHDEWRRYGKGAWNYSENKGNLQAFWRGGMERMKGFETITTIGMRGDGDEPMSEEHNIALLEKIVYDQRKIIADVTGKKADETPQIWALYKEVQDYYDRGMRVPDDVTLLLCDDNWGNVRKLPSLQETQRKGGYGMYYHFDYVGGPRNYKWINVTQVQRLWEQMNLTYSHGVDEVWMVNVGDLKPMEYPISFFLDMAWNPTLFTSSNLLQHTENWCAQQFGQQYAVEAARLIDLYTKYNRRITPELLNDTVYSLDNYNEFERVVTEYRNLAFEAMRLNYLIPKDYKDAFDQLVLFPINACANLYEMYFAVAKNKQYAKLHDPAANQWADKVKECFERDSLLTYHYNNIIADGKWAHIMDQVRIGYSSWQQPERSIIPEVIYVEEKQQEKTKVFIEKDKYISIDAENFVRSKSVGAIEWHVIAGLGKTKSGVTIFPQNIYPASDDSIYIEYDIETVSLGEPKLHVFVSPTLNFNDNKGLRYAASFNGGKETIVNINGEYDERQMEKWQAMSINETVTKHSVLHPGKQTLRIRMLDPGIVLQKLVIDFGGLKQSYLGPPESEYKCKQ